MIKFHPSNQQLTLFAEGTLPPTESLLIAAHCDMCQRCAQKVAFYTDVYGECFTYDDVEIDNVELTFERTRPEFDAMLNDITSEEVGGPICVSQQSQVLELDGRQFQVPQSLSRFIGSIGNWSHLIGKLWQAPVYIGGDAVANFIFMEKGGSVPEHTHRGSEMTLVVSGEFCDGLATYDTGDFMTMSGRHTHAPTTKHEDGCLVFTIVDKPLHFTSGWARLINPFSHVFLNRN